VFENDTVESIETFRASQPKISVRGLCQCVHYTWRTVFRSPRCMRELRNGPITAKPGSTRASKREEKAGHKRPNNVSRTDECPSFRDPFSFAKSNHDWQSLLRILSSASLILSGVVCTFQWDAVAGPRNGRLADQPVWDFAMQKRQSPIFAVTIAASYCLFRRSHRRVTRRRRMIGLRITSSRWNPNGLAPRTWNSRLGVSKTDYPAPIGLAHLHLSRVITRTCDRIEQRAGWPMGVHSPIFIPGSAAIREQWLIVSYTAFPAPFLIRRNV
jgi:hypothetical protein